VSQEKFFKKRAKEALKLQFTTHRGKPRKTPFYQSQLQILHEKDFYTWVVVDALRELVEEGFLTKITEGDIPNFETLKNLKHLNFYFNSGAVTTAGELEEMQEKTFRIAKVVNEYSDPTITKNVGDHLETLVKQELRAQNFTVVGENTNEFENKKWTNTEHDLDFIAVHKVFDNLKIGVEVKNTLSIMPPKEIDIKIEICEHLGLAPVFAVRWIKPYFYCINNQGGFCWMIKTQCYPLGYKDFTEGLYTKLSDLDRTDSKGHKLEFPVIERSELPPNTIKVFEDWIQRVQNQPPTANPTIDRCTR